MNSLVKILLALLTGVLVCLSFPTVIGGFKFPEMGWIGWFALVPLILVIKKATPREAFLYTFLSAFVWYLGSVYWVYNAMYYHGGVNSTASVLVLLLLVVIIAAYIALAPMFARFIEMKWKGELLVWLPVAWVAMEIMRNYFPCGGFPWVDVATSQWKNLPVIQITDMVGVYGLIFIIVWVNTFISELVAHILDKDVKYFPSKAIMTIILIGATVGYGYYKLATVPASLVGSISMSIGLIQGDIPQDEKWDKETAVKNLNVHRSAARRLMDAGVEMIVWPEASFPWSVRERDTEIDPRTLGFFDDKQGDKPYTLFGAVHENDDGTFYNSAILFEANGKIIGRYHKSRLVPFGEFVPYKKLLFFVDKITTTLGNFLNGTSREPLMAGPVKFGALICFEDIFPEVAREEVARGARFLANVTNDAAWFGNTSATFQHQAMAVFRSVETRRFMVRANNRGVSAIITPTGRVDVESGVFEPALIVAPVALLDELTPYVVFGDWFAWGCLVYAVLGIVAGVYRLRKKRRKL